MVRRALLVGIDEYKVFNPLNSCVADATAMEKLLERNADGSPNYSCRLMVYGKGTNTLEITRPLLREACYQLFDEPGDVLFYFSGHGSLTKVGGYIATAESQADDWGIPMREIIELANISRARDVVVILDCCHAGEIGNVSIFDRPGERNPIATLRENMTVIAASRASGSSVEGDDKYSLFTESLLDALDGGAADHMGWVTAQSTYAYVERGFGGWVQRPVYKSHATDLTVIRQCAPLIERLKLHQLVELFPVPDHKFQLDPEYDPQDEHGNFPADVNPDKIACSILFKEYRDVGLVKSTSGEQFFWVARQSGTLELTLRGREYWRLIKGKRI